jgi:hypothetical protein
MCDSDFASPFIARQRTHRIRSCRNEAQPNGNTMSIIMWVNPAQKCQHPSGRKVAALLLFVVALHTITCASGVILSKPSTWYQLL